MMKVVVSSPVLRYARHLNLKFYCCSGTGTGRYSVWGTGRMADGINWSNVSATKTVDAPSIQCAESKYGLIIQFLALVVMIHEVWLKMRKIVLRIKPHFMYHDNYSQELNYRAIFGFSTLNWRGINCFGYRYILGFYQCNLHSSNAWEKISIQCSRASAIWMVRLGGMSCRKLYWFWYPHEIGKHNKMCLNEPYSRVRRAEIFWHVYS